MDLKIIKKFVELIEETDIVELQWEKDGLKTVSYTHLTLPTN